MAKISKSIDINAPVEQVYDYFTQPENLPTIWPSLVEVSKVQRSADGSHSFDWVYKMAGIRFSGHSQTTEVERNKRVISKNERGIPSTFEYLWEAKGNKTHVTFNVDYTIPGKILSKLAEPIVHRINEREAETLLLNLKDQLEMMQAKGARPHAK